METNAIKMTSCCRAVGAFLTAASDITSTRSLNERQQRLFDALFSVLPCDAAALFAYSEDDLIPIAVKGLRSDVLGRRFKAGEHPRLRAVLEADNPIVFDGKNNLPDPFDGVQEAAPFHRAEMGTRLRVGDDIVGALMIDVEESGVTRIDAREFSLFAAFAAANLQAAALSDSLDEFAKDRSKSRIAGGYRRGEDEMLGHSREMDRLRQEIRIVADADLTVLITGETGTGKELVARKVHAQSSRLEEPLVYVNCAALPESIAESELFGHVKGAYTGADTTRVGKFELADGGTLFLDEIGELPLSVQPKLLRAIQSGEIQRLGSDQNAEVNVRIIAATNRDLKAEVAAGRFRIDLYHRLSVYPIEVPPLRERGEDIGLLAGHFLDQTRARIGLGPAQLTATALERLLRYNWPGNVRELEHVVTRSALRAARGRLGESVIVDDRHLDIGDLDVPVKRGALDLAPSFEEPDFSLKESVVRHKRRVIAEAVKRAGGNWAEAARRLKLHRSNLYRTAKQVGLKVSHENRGD